MGWLGSDMRIVFLHVKIRISFKFRRWEKATLLDMVS